jgi:hypothetical protein
VSSPVVNAVESSASVFHGSGPRWLSPVSHLTRRSYATAYNSGYSHASTRRPFSDSDCLGLPAFELDSTNCAVSRLVRYRRSVKFLRVFASVVIPGFSLFDIHEQDFYSLLDMYMLGLPFRRRRGRPSEFRFTLRLAVYRQSVRLGAKPLEVHDQR